MGLSLYLHASDADAMRHRLRTRSPQHPCRRTARRRVARDQHPDAAALKCVRQRTDRIRWAGHTDPRILNGGSLKRSFPMTQSRYQLPALNTTPLALLTTAYDQAEPVVTQ